MLKKLVVTVLNKAVKSYLTRNKVLVVGVAGSVGKTSTVSAIRTVLSQKYKVHIPATTYNTNRSIHVELFNLPFATSTIGWAKSSLTILWRSFQKAPYEVVVFELGTDHPGELSTFAFLHPHVSVVTAVAPEHMEYFKTIEAVAVEEMGVATFSDKTLVNADMVAEEFRSSLGASVSLFGSGTSFTAGNYRWPAGTLPQADFIINNHIAKNVSVQVVGEHSLHALIAAATVGHELHLSLEQIVRGIGEFRPVKGRMQLLNGIQDSTIIDDTYNSSPEAVRGALKMLYELPAKQRIAILGNMNEMGDFGPSAYKELGKLCDPKKLDLLVTIGEDAEKYLGEEAKANGCTVKSFLSPYEAGSFTAGHVKRGAVIMAKGSQNGVFAEEALKPLLADKKQESLLVRQSEYWLRQKATQFK